MFPYIFVSCSSFLCPLEFCYDFAETRSRRLPHFIYSSCALSLLIKLWSCIVQAKWIWYNTARDNLKRMNTPLTHIPWMRITFSMYWGATHEQQQRQPTGDSTNNISNKNKIRLRNNSKMGASHTLRITDSLDLESRDWTCHCHFGLAWYGVGELSLSLVSWRILTFY